jgi:hypothetical protein
VAVCFVWRGMLRDCSFSAASLSIHPTLSLFCAIWLLDSYCGSRTFFPYCSTLLFDVRVVFFVHCLFSS